MLVLAALCLIVCGGLIVAAWQNVRGRRGAWATCAFIAFVVGGYLHAKAWGDQRLDEERAVCVGRGGVAATAIAKDQPRRVTCRDGRTYTLAD